MDNEEKLKHIVELNKKYRANNCNGIISNGSNFKIIHGKLPILLSAPHAVRQNRNGEVKGADTLTGPIVEFLCERTDTNGIIRTFNLQDDPNSQNMGNGLEYKKAILELIRQKNILCMFDFHGCNDSHPFDIDIGTNNGININVADDFLNIIYKRLSTISSSTIDKKFKASQNTTVCNYISRKSNISCFQIELCTSLRKNPDNLLQLLDSFEIIIEELSRQINLKRNDAEIEI